jgi:aldehyde dehydrogenase (NAD+)
MITSPLVDMVTFTGGLEAGLDIARKMADSGNILKKYVSELGGCSALIVNDDADIERSARETLKGCFKNSGQRCTAIRMIIVIKSVAEIFVKRLVGEVEKLKYGDPYDETVDMGTVISEEAAIVLEERVSNAIKDGADLLLGNKRDGALYSPTVLDNVNIDSELVSNETFGPIAPIIRVENLDEAISFAKKTGYRLAGAVMTKKREIAEKVSNELIVGQFSWNGFPSYRTEAAPFGGFKNSGNGEKEGAILAAYGMRRIRTFYEH